MTPPEPLVVDPSNSAQASAWDGPQGTFWTDRADRFDAGAERYVPHLMDAAELAGDSRVLDVGCGSGAVARAAARRAPAGTVLGVDLSSRQLDLARSRATREGLANLTFVQADAQVHPFPEQSLDAVLSRHGAMFFGDPVAAFGNLTSALRPGGRVALVTWQPLSDNEWISTFRRILGGGRDLPVPSPGAPGPFSMSEPVRVREVLAAAGLVDVRLTGVREPMFYGHDVEDAASFVEQSFAGLLDGLPGPAVEDVRGVLRADLADHLTADGVHYGSAAWLVTARRP